MFLLFFQVDSGIEKEIEALQLEVCEELPNYPHLLFLSLCYLSHNFKSCYEKKLVAEIKRTAKTRNEVCSVSYELTRFMPVLKYLSL